jgi:starvation-inducible DNA-binding protein
VDEVGRRIVADAAAARDDVGTNDLLVTDVIRLNERQAWFVSQHVVDEPLVRA